MEKSFVRKVHEMFMKAVDDGNKVRAIATDIGMSEYTLHAFKKRKSMSMENIELLSGWLEGHGYLLPQPKPLCVDDATTLLRDFLEIADAGLLSEEQLWRQLRLNCEALLREMPR